MPKQVAYRVTWSAQTQVYEVQRRDALASTGIATESPAWLEEVSSFTFHSRDGHTCSVRKERFQRGGAYGHTPHKLVKCYLGRSSELTIARLEEVVAQLSAADVVAPAEGSVPMKPPEVLPSASGETQCTLLLAASLARDERVAADGQGAPASVSKPPTASFPPTTTTNICVESLDQVGVDSP